jgi:hypothetical protein
MKSDFVIPVATVAFSELLQTENTQDSCNSNPLQREQFLFPYSLFLIPCSCFPCSLFQFVYFTEHPYGRVYGVATALPAMASVRASET